MKNFTSLILLIFISSLYSTQINAQEGYSYTLIHDGGYNFTIAAVPNFDSGTFEPITESYGFVLVLPDGITATFIEYLPAGTSAIISPIAGSALGSLDPGMADNDLYLVTTTTNAATFDAHVVEAVIPLVSFTVNGSPTNGEIRILSNDSVLVMNYAPLESFMQVDVIDDGTVIFANGILPTTGLKGITSFQFNTLTVEEIVLEDTSITVYPNPAVNTFYIKGLFEATTVSIYDISGKLMMTESTNSNQAIAIDKLSSGMYLVSIKNNKGTVIKKLVIE